MSATRVDSAYDCMRSEPATLIALALPVDCSVKTVAATITDSASSATTDSTIPTRTSVESDHTRRRKISGFTGSFSHRSAARAAVAANGPGNGDYLPAAADPPLPFSGPTPVGVAAVSSDEQTSGAG